MANTLHKNDLPDDLDLGPIVAIDCETMGLIPHRDRLCLVQLSSGDGNAHLVQISQDQTEAPNLCRMLTDPDVLKLFEGGRLGALEAKCLLLLSNGHNMNEVAKVLDLSDLTIRILIKCAIRKLGAKTQYNAISLALSSGEISNLKLGRHELM